jgi:hypothetical protein
VIALIATSGAFEVDTGGTDDSPEEETPDEETPTGPHETNMTAAKEASNKDFVFIIYDLHLLNPAFAHLELYELPQPICF